MKNYTFWNNKGGTGKTSLNFQCIVRYAEVHPDERILVVDLCPQSNLSELLLGGLSGNGATNLATMYQSNPRKSIGGYFDARILSPYTMPAINANDYICTPNSFNGNIPVNVRLMTGDSVVELQATYMSAIANGSLPNGNNPYAFVLCWLKDYLGSVNAEYDVVFIDTNPSFSIYTQIAIAATENLIVPVMADDSSRRALENVLTLVYGYNTPHGYAANNFNSIMLAAKMVLPKIHLVVKNRITQYMGAASGYRAVLQSIDNIVQNAYLANPAFFGANFSIKEVRDFQTTGVIAFAEAKSFATLNTEPLQHMINGQSTTLRKEYIQQYIDNIDQLISVL